MNLYSDKEKFIWGYLIQVLYTVNVFEEKIFPK